LSHIYCKSKKTKAVKHRTLLVTFLSLISLDLNNYAESTLFMPLKTNLFNTTFLVTMIANIFANKLALLIIINKFVFSFFFMLALH